MEVASIQVSRFVPVVQVIARAVNSNPTISLVLSGFAPRGQRSMREAEIAMAEELFL